MDYVDFMSDLNYTENTKELSFIDLFINIWKFKINFLYILIPSFIFFFLLYNFITKKSLIEVRLDDPDKILLNIFPADSVLTDIVIKDVTFLGLHTGLGSLNKVELNFLNYFERELLPIDKLYTFAKLNKKKYNFYEFISKKRSHVFRPNTNETNLYRLVLPDQSENNNFFREFISYSFINALKRYSLEALEIEKKKISVIKRDLNSIDAILSKYDQRIKPNDILTNLEIISLIYQERLALIKQNVDYLNNTEFFFKNDWLIRGPTSKQIGKKIYTFAKFFGPFLLSLIIYFLYILVKLSKQYRKN